MKTFSTEISSLDTPKKSRGNRYTEVEERDDYFSVSLIPNADNSGESDSCNSDDSISENESSTENSDNDSDLTEITFLFMSTSTR